MADQVSLSYFDELSEATEKLWGLAQEMGLRPFPTHFEIVPGSIMYEFGAYGMPGRFSHWTHGKQFQQMKTMYDYGLSKIYELVINTNPSYAYLLDVNSVLQNKFVVAHVLGHTDFFANSALFAGTSRQMVETMNRDAERIAGYEYEHGKLKVEQLLDAALALEEHIDPYADVETYQTAFVRPDKPKRRKPGPYDDLWGQAAEPEGPPVNHHVERGPYHDLLLFLLTHSPVLEEWERDVVSIVRNEMLYFIPQMRTKVINEGWAVFWHLRLMRALDTTGRDTIDVAEMHSSVLQPSKRSINPYYVGNGLLEDINRLHGGNETDVAPVMFEIRERESDVSLVRNYLTKDLVKDMDLYIYEKRGDELVVVEKDWEKIRDKLAQFLTDRGRPEVVIVDGDYLGQRELLLEFIPDGRKLDEDFAGKTLPHLYRLWGRRVHLRIPDGDTVKLMHYDPEKNVTYG